MLMVVVLSAAILLVTAFCLKRKRLHLFEIVAIWLAVIVVNAPAYSYFLINQGWIEVPENREFALVRIVYTMVLNSLFFAWVLDWALVRLRPLARIPVYLAMLAVLLGGGWFLDRWGIIRFKPAGWLFYIPLKAIVLLAALCSVSLVRYLMRKDGVRIDTVTRN
ncbi:hypothetical protein [Cohnella candidum]|uniref:Uncharacterized protein n=1 Tax=Cohnella candidum TaxID=2674991 RepID=A0A3G3K170_9BACL|nr:hypothetical protein [Cohnella candidum]AYQ74294.1 hypothetical protein EAV92_18010 [Cohnella candidum]